jgi:UDP-N-acetylglucosamine acyltransferase
MNQQLSFIHPDAKIAKNVIIEPFTVIKGDVEIGEGTWIGNNVTIMEGARIGKNCKIFPGAVISSTPQDLKFGGEVTTCFIGDNTIVREYATISRGTHDRMKTVIGKNCLIMAYVHVAHDCIIGDNVILVNSVQLAGHVIIDDFAIIGGTSAILQFVHVGEHVMVGGGSKIRKDIPPYVKISREPAVYVGINSVGLRRRGFSNEKIFEIQEIYRRIYLNGMNNSQAMDEIEFSMSASEERDKIINFVRKSEKGIVKG